MNILIFANTKCKTFFVRPMAHSDAALYSKGHGNNMSFRCSTLVPIRFAHLVHGQTVDVSVTPHSPDCKLSDALSCPALVSTPADTSKGNFMNKPLIQALVVAFVASLSFNPVSAAQTQEEVFKEMQETAERIRKQQQEWEEDSKRAREERKRVLERQAAERRRDAESRKQQEAREAAELAAAKNARDKQKALEKARQEAQARMERAEREREAELQKLREVDEALAKRKQAQDKEIEELRRQGKLGGEINFGVDL